MQFILVFIGGGLGSLSRFGIAKMIAPYSENFPFATLTSNILSCILLGFLLYFSLRNQMNEAYRLLFMVGFCGAFSTFSTFSSETFQLFQNGDIVYGVLNIFGNTIICLLAIWLGFTLGKLV